MKIVIYCSSHFSKGSDVAELTYKPLDLDLFFHAPTGYRKPGSIVGTCKRSEGEFREYYGGGWQDILPFAGNEPVKTGSESEVCTARLPFFLGTQ